MSTNEPTPPPLPSSWQADEQQAVETAEKGSRRFWIITVVLVLVLFVVSVLVVSNQGDGVKERAWPATIDNRPGGLGEGDTTEGAVPTASPGVYVWSDLGGWHLWIVNGEGVDGLTGSITSTDPIVSAEMSTASDGTVSIDDKELNLELKGEAPVEGITFDPGFSHHLDFNLETASGPVPDELIFLGADAENPSEAPLSLDKPVVNES